MGDIVEGRFGIKQEVVFQCLNCEAQSFWLDEEGTITCKVCKTKQVPPREWVDKCLSNIDPEITEDE